MTSTTNEHLHLADRYLAHNYHPLPVIITSAEGAWVTDVEGRRYLDCLAGYSALNFGHRHPALIAAAHEELDRLTLTSRAFHNDQIGPFAQDLAELTRMDAVLPMNTGAEAVETALKAARRWGYRVKGVPADRASIIVMEGNFHGRTTTIVSFSTDPDARADFGPFTPGFRAVPFGDAAAIEAAIDDTTVAVLLEPIQGEAGIVIPPDGFLADVRRICDRHGLLFLADEIQSGLARTGETFAVDHEQVQPDVFILGKALGGGIAPLSAIAAKADVMGVFTPGSHGSTFGGNPLATRIGREVLSIVRSGEFQERSARLGDVLARHVQPLLGNGLLEIRHRGLWFGLDIDPTLMSGRDASMRLLERGVLAKDTHGSTIRLAPPLVVGEDELLFVAEQLTAVLGG